MPHPLNTPNQKYVSYSQNADANLGILEQNLKYQFFLSDQNVINGTNVNPSITNINPPQIDLTNGGLLKTVNSFKTINEGFTNPTSQNTDNIKNINSNHGDILKLRAELDQKLIELHGLDNSIGEEYKINYDTTLYTGLVWSILATSVLYFVFVKI